MTKEVVFNGWVSLIPQKMFNKWVKKGLVPNTVTYVEEGEDNEKPHWRYYLYKNGEPIKNDFSKQDEIDLKAEGWKKCRGGYVVESAVYYEMHKNIVDWYKKVFTFLDQQLKNEGLIKIEKGSFLGGFCAEEDRDKDVVQNWGAPLECVGNKVTQIKEKFGRIVVYFKNLTEEERKKVNKIARLIKRKFDCFTDFT